MSGTPVSYPTTIADRAAGLNWSGYMQRWAARTATIAGFDYTGLGNQRRLYVPLATTALAGAQSAADKTKLDTLAQMGQWLTLPYAANWSDWGAGETAGAYRYDGLGFVVLKGLVKKSIALVGGDVICTLPVGFRPVTEWIFAAASAAGYTEIRVNTGGAVYIVAGGSAAFTSLAQIRFDPAT